MTDINQLLLQKDHRSFAMPTTKWMYYQEWNNALFMHWKVPYDLLKALVPEELTLDTFEGEAYVSLVAFTMQKIRPRYLPAIKFISDFEEINLRTYIDMGDKKGVYFLNIEAQKQLSVFVAKALSGLPYEKAHIVRKPNAYTSSNTKKGYQLDVQFEVKEKNTTKTALDHWLTERYCLYIDQDDQMYRYDIHHKEWEINAVKLDHLALNYTLGEIQLTPQPDLVHYSKGVEVVAWKRSGLT